MGDYEDDSSAQGRLRAWNAALQMAIDFPLGVGANNFSRAYGRYYIPENTSGYGALRWISPHSVYFRVLGEYGYPGLALLLVAALVHLPRQPRRRGRHEAAPGGRPSDTENWPLLLNVGLGRLRRRRDLPRRLRLSAPVRPERADGRDQRIVPSNARRRAAPAAPVTQPAAAAPAPRRTRPRRWRRPAGTSGGRPRPALFVTPLAIVAALFWLSIGWRWSTPTSAIRCCSCSCWPGAAGTTTRAPNPPPLPPSSCCPGAQRARQHLPAKLANIAALRYPRAPRDHLRLRRQHRRHGRVHRGARRARTTLIALQRPRRQGRGAQRRPRPRPPRHRGLHRRVDHARAGRARAHRRAVRRSRGRLRVGRGSHRRRRRRGPLRPLRAVRAPASNRASARSSAPADRSTRMRRALCEPFVAEPGARLLVGAALRRAGPPRRRRSRRPSASMAHVADPTRRVQPQGPHAAARHHHARRARPAAEPVRARFLRRPSSARTSWRAGWCRSSWPAPW